MLINEEGKEKSIEVKNSRTAGVIGRYFNSIKHFLNTGDKSKLNRFKNKKIKDSSGRIHRLETNPENIIKINQRIEEPELVCGHYTRDFKECKSQNQHKKIILKMM